MLLLAHRGYHHAAPENSLAAFDAAVEMGVDGIEADVRLSRDKQAVLIHDRVLGDDRQVAQLTRREIDQVLGHPVATLAEALERFDNILWNIEIKTADVFPAVVEILRRYLQSRRLLVTSFRHELVARCAELLNVQCGLLVAHHPVRLRELLNGHSGRPNIRSIVWDYNIIDEEMLHDTAAAGWSSFAYGAVTRFEHRHCAGLDLAGLITDFPQYLKK